MKGLLVNVFNCGFFDSLSPIKDAKNVVIVGSGMPEIFNATEEHPPVRIVKRMFSHGEYIHAEPYEKGNYSFGGRYIFCCDSRVREINKYPIPLHDRDMSKEH